MKLAVFQSLSMLMTVTNTTGLRSSIPQLARDLAFTISISFLILLAIFRILPAVFSENKNSLEAFQVSNIRLFRLVVVFSLAVTAVMEISSRLFRWLYPAWFEADSSTEDRQEKDVEAHAGRSNVPVIDEKSRLKRECDLE
ncbi:hypothetical protein H0H87_007125 [Tephrocybe sp. NHM501043]|nr:hypothetical protein H0H87_007125 [Tephrocybe sp. NHM501043]